MSSPRPVNRAHRSLLRSAPRGRRAASLVVAVLSVAFSAACLSLNAASASRRDASPPPPVPTVLADTNPDAVLALLRDNTARATSTPAPTPLLAASCPGGVWWYAVRSGTRGTVTVEGRVVGGTVAPVGGRPTVVLDLGQPAPDPNRVVLLIRAGVADETQRLLGLTGAKTSVCATGQVGEFDGVPAVELAGPADIAPAR